MDYSKFRLRTFTRLKPFCSLHCGSNYELPIKYSSHPISDVDVLLYCYDICAIPLNRNPPKNTRCTILRIESTETPSGYAKLKIHGEREKSAYYHRPRMLSNVESGGPSMQSVEKYTSTIREQYKHGSFDVDMEKVFSICCPYWPVEAEEWRVRKRFHGWPNEKLIARITRGGCHFVSKLRTWSSCDDTEWRFSFSKAELLLIHSWTPDQKFAYHVVRVIKREISKYFGGDGNKLLQTYYFKTLMLWACEEFPPEFWREENMITYVETLFNRFYRCLEVKCCPSYFIPDCNIMSHLKEWNFDKELQALLKDVVKVGAKYTVLPFKATSQCVWELSFEHQCLYIIHTSFPINEHLNGRFSEYLSECEWLLPGMKSLHAAIEAHLRLMSIDNVASRKESKDYVECLENFKCALVRNEDFDSFRYANRELSFYEIVNAILIRKQTRNSIPIYRRTLRKDLEADAIDHLAKRSLRSPLFFIASAYRANFYFTAMKSYKESLNECDEWIDLIYKVDDILNGITSRIPILICNSLSQIYDEYLQVILGFVTLHRNISFYESSNPSTAHEVCLKLSAKEFLKYLSIQCEHKLSVIDVTVVRLYDSKLGFEVPWISQLMEDDVYSAVILFAALRQSRAHTVPLAGIHLPRHFRTVQLRHWGASSTIEWEKLW